MTKSRSRSVVGGRFMILIAGLLLAVPPARAQEKDNLDPGQIPKKVLGTLKAKFPKAVIDKWTKEKEGEIFIYDIEFKQEGRKFEADIKEDGSIHNWEEAINPEDLPETVKRAVEQKYSNSTLKEVMVITEVKDGKDVLEGYEIILETADKKEVEVTVAPDGTILEDSGETK